MPRSPRLSPGDHRRARPVQPRRPPPQPTARARPRPGFLDRHAANAPPSGQACINRPRAATTRHASSSDHALPHGRGKLPHGCPNSTPAHGPSSQTAGRRHLHRKQRRLRMSVRSTGRPPQPSSLEQHDAKRHIQPASRPQRLRTRPRAKHVIAPERRPMPTDCPAPGTEHQPTPLTRRSLRHRCVRPTLAERKQRLRRIRRVSRRDRRTHRKVRPMQRRRAQNSRPIDIRMPRQPVGIPLRLRTQRRLVPTRHQQRYTRYRFFSDRRAGRLPAAPHRASRAGASSSTTCAFVPLMPNDDTPARRTRDASLRHGRASCNSDSPLPSHSICSLGRSACSVFGRSSCCNDSTILITPNTPAAACACPMLDFDDPNHSGCASPRVGPNTAANAPASIGSPRLVPVPCASTASMPSGLRPLADSAARITRC